MFCKNCGKELPDSAKFCDGCGAAVDEPTQAATPTTDQVTPPKKKKKHPVLLGLVIAFAVLVLLSIIFGDDKNSGDGSNTTPSMATATQQETVPPTTEKQSYTVGDTIEKGDLKVTFDTFQESSGGEFLAPDEGNAFLLCEFTVENDTLSDINVSSVLCFEAYVDDYTVQYSLSATSFADGATLDGTIASGKKMHGVIGYEVPADWKNFEIRFTPSASILGKTFTFEVSK